MITRKGRSLFLAAAFIALAPLARGQRYSDWRVFRASDGLAESACVSVCVGLNGNVFVKHFDLDSVSELDGYSVLSFPSPEIGRNRVYQGPGDQLWTITSTGLEEFQNGAWQLHPVPQFAKEFRGMVTAAIPPLPLHVISQDRVLTLLPDQLLAFSNKNSSQSPITILRTAGEMGLGKFLGMMAAKGGSLWISAEHGLSHAPGQVSNLTANTQWQDYVAPRNLQAQNFQQPMADVDRAGITCAADSSSGDQKLVVHFDGRNWTAQPIGTEKIRAAWQGSGGVTWVVTLNSVLQFDSRAAPAAEVEEVAAGRYFDAAVETNGVFWLASSEGLLRYSPPLWKSPRSLQPLNTPVPCMAEDSAGRLWFISADGLCSLQGDRYQELFPAEYRHSLQSARTLLPLKNGDLLLDTGDQLFQFHPGEDSLSLLPSSPHVKQHALGLFRDGSVAFQVTDAKTQTCQLEKYDGIAFKPFLTLPAAYAYSTLLEAQNGDLWVGGDGSVARYHDRAWQTFSNNLLHAIVSFVDTVDGKVWCATPDSLWEFDGRNWAPIHTGFDQINSLIRTQNGNIWVASNGGLYRFINGVWVENSLEEGLPNTVVRQVYEDPHGQLWAATARGLSLFHPEVDSDPPRTRIRKQPDKDSIPQGATMVLYFEGEDKWKYTPSERLLYSYRIDQHYWSQFLEGNNVPYSDLSPGSHTFEVRAMDRNGNVESKPARLLFTISVPWYRETRLVIISFCGIVAVLFFAGLAFNRHRKLLLSYAEVERKVAERTRELEITSRELLHSQKMNALGTLAAGIAHDFNNILSIIKGSAQIIEDNVENSEKIRTRVDRIKTVVEQGAGIVKAMLGFSVGSGEEPVLCDPNAVAAETIQLLGDRFQRDTAVIFKPDPDLPQTPAVKEFVQQILLNFIFNAAEAEAAVKKKQITLSTRRAQHLPENLALAPGSASEYVMISVQDSGCGIPPENLLRIFEPFFTTKALSARRGTGLGLSMVYELAKKMHAGLSVESAVNTGSTFTLILPVSKIL